MHKIIFFTATDDTKTVPLLFYCPVRLVVDFNFAMNKLYNKIEEFLENFFRIFVFVCFFVDLHFILCVYLIINNNVLSLKVKIQKW